MTPRTRACTTTSREPAPGEVWLAYVYFEDHPDVGKVRPVVIVEVRGGADVAVAAKVTSKDVGARGALAVEIPDWRACGLRRPSWVRIDQRFELPFSDILRDEPLGRLPGDVFREVALAVGPLA